MITQQQFEEEIKKEFAEKFLVQNTFSSENQFKKELQEDLYEIFNVYENPKLKQTYFNDDCKGKLPKLFLEFVFSKLRQQRKMIRDEILAELYCGTARDNTMIPNPFYEKPEKKPKIYVEKGEHLTLSHTLLPLMKRLIDNGRWRWKSQPRKESWLNKHFKFMKRLGVMLP